MGWILTAGAVLVAASWVGYRKRLASLRATRLDNDAIRQIEERGRLEVEEPLDLREAAEEEDRFWNESWDEPEPW